MTERNGAGAYGHTRFGQPAGGNRTAPAASDRRVAPHGLAGDAGRELHFPEQALGGVHRHRCRRTTRPSLDSTAARTRIEPRLRAAWDNAVATGMDFRLHCRIRRFDGVYRWFETRGNAVSAIRMGQSSVGSEPTPTCTTPTKPAVSLPKRKSGCATWRWPRMTPSTIGTCSMA